MLRELRAKSALRSMKRVHEETSFSSLATHFFWLPVKQTLYHLRCNHGTTIPPVQLQTAKQS